MLRVIASPAEDDSHGLTAELLQKTQTLSLAENSFNIQLDQMAKSLEDTAIDRSNVGSNVQEALFSKYASQTEKTLVRAQMIFKESQDSLVLLKATLRNLPSSNKGYHRMFGFLVDDDNFGDENREQAFLSFCVGLQVFPRLRCSCNLDIERPVSSFDGVSNNEDPCLKCRDNFIMQWFTFVFANLYIVSKGSHQSLITLDGARTAQALRDSIHLGNHPKASWRARALDDAWTQGSVLPLTEQTSRNDSQLPFAYNLWSELMEIWCLLDYHPDTDSIMNDNVADVMDDFGSLQLAIKMLEKALHGTSLTLTFEEFWESRKSRTRRIWA